MLKLNLVCRKEVFYLQDLLELNGTVEDIIYQNSDNGYSVFSFSCDDDEIICVGTVPDIHNGETLKITGNWTMHPTYGRQLQIQYYEKSIPTTTEGMVKYLSSGLIKGIGPKIAKKIVDKFGEATFYVIEEKPDRLVEIKGITYEKAMKISNTFSIKSNRILKFRFLMLLLHKIKYTHNYPSFRF